MQIIFGRDELPGKLIDGVLYAPVCDLVAMMGYGVKEMPIGVKIMETVVPIDTALGNYRGVIIGSAVYCPAHALLVGEGYKVSRTAGPGAGMLIARR